VCCAPQPSQPSPVITHASQPRQCLNLDCYLIVRNAEASLVEIESRDRQSCLYRAGNGSRDLFKAVHRTYCCRRWKITPLTLIFPSGLKAVGKYEGFASSLIFDRRQLCGIHSFAVNLATGM